MYSSSNSSTHTTTTSALKASVTRPQRQVFAHRLGALAATAAIAASLSTALPLVADATGHLSNSGGTSAVTFVVTKGQKG